MEKKSNDRAAEVIDGALDSGRQVIGIVSGATETAIDRISTSVSSTGKALSSAVEMVSEGASYAKNGGTKALAKTAEISSTIAQKTSEVTFTAVTLVGDLNGDGRLDGEDLKIARDAAAQALSMIGEGAVEAGKSAAKSDMVKQAATGAALGAIISIPLPVVGPAIGASVGAIFGIWRSIAKPDVTVLTPTSYPSSPMDHLEQIERLAAMRNDGILTEEEFQRQKAKLLR